MTTLTISRQLGSFGTTLGRQIAARLGYRLVHREIVNEAAILAGAPEMALATIDELGLLGLKPDETHQRLYLQAVRKVIEDLAEAGKVIIVGRAGQAILRPHRQPLPGVLHLRVIAPLETRIQRIVKFHNVSPQAAQAQLEDSDRARAHYLQQYYAIRGDDPAHYHLIINTGYIDLETAAEVVCTMVRRMETGQPAKDTALG